MVIVGIDPGQTTGFSVLNAPMEVVSYGQVTDVTLLLQAIGEHRPDVVVMEDFKLYSGSAQRLSWNDLPAPQVIGVIKNYCEQNDIELITQTPSTRKFFTDALLKFLDLYIPGKQHAVDSLRHALYYAWFTAGYKDTKEVQDVLKRYIKRIG